MGTRAHALYTYYHMRLWAHHGHARVCYILRVLVMYVRVRTGHCEFFHENNKFNGACAAEEKKRRKKKKGYNIMYKHDWRWETYIRGRSYLLHCARESAGSPNNDAINEYIYICLPTTRKHDVSSAIDARLLHSNCSFYTRRTWHFSGTIPIGHTSEWH